MGGREGEAEQLLAVEGRHAEADVRAVGGTVVGRVVDDHVALVELLAALGEELEDAPHIAGDRTQLERGGEGRLAKLASLRVEQGAAEVLRLSDDAGVGHPGQLVAHLDGDALESAGDNTGADRVNARVSGLPGSPASGVPSGEGLILGMAPMPTVRMATSSMGLSLKLCPYSAA